MSKPEPLPPVPSLPDTVNLAGIRHRVRQSEGLVVFSPTDNVWSTYCRIAFERVCGCWQVSIESSSGSASITHIIKAYEVIKSVYGGNFEYNGREINEHCP